MSARVLVTGAAGGIGEAAVAMLRARGARVVGLDLMADDTAEVIACDVRDQSSVDTCVAEAVERLAGRALTDAALGEPSRDRATTRQGTLNYVLARHVPRRLMDRVISARLRRLARRGHFDDSSIAGEMVARLRA